MFLSGNRLQERRQRRTPESNKVFQIYDPFSQINQSRIIPKQEIHWWWQLCVRWFSGSCLSFLRSSDQSPVQRFDRLTPLSPRLTVFLWCSEFPSCLAPFEIGYNVEGLSTKLRPQQSHCEFPENTRRWQHWAARSPNIQGHHIFQESLKQVKVQQSGSAQVNHIFHWLPIFLCVCFF